MFKRCIMGFSCTCLSLIWLSQSPIPAFGNSNEIGPRHVGTARNIYQGSLQLSAQGRFYTKTDIFTGPGNIESGVTVWDSETGLSLSYGLWHHLEFSATQILTQKSHETATATDFPGDLLLMTKFGSLGRKTFSCALQLETRLPLAAHHNVPLHSYSANSTGYGLTFLWSWNSNPATPEKGFGWDTNFGFYSHNDQGLTLTDNPDDTIAVEKNTQELIIGSAVKYETTLLTFYLEAHSRLFLQPPPITAYTREHHLYVSPGLAYRFNPSITLVFGADYLILGTEDQTTYSENNVQLVEKHWQTIPNLPEWRVNLGVQFNLLKGKAPPQREPRRERKKSTGSVQLDERDESRKRSDDDIRVLEERLKSQQQKQNQSRESEAERESRMQRERERMDELLQGLRAYLEEVARKEQEELEAERKRQEELEAERRKQEELAKQAELEAQELLESDAPSDTVSQDSLAQPPIDAEELQPETQEISESDAPSDTVGQDSLAQPPIDEGELQPGDAAPTGDNPEEQLEMPVDDQETVDDQPEGQGRSESDIEEQSEDQKERSQEQSEQPEEQQVAPQEQPEEQPENQPEQIEEPPNDQQDQTTDQPDNQKDRINESETPDG